MSLSFPEPSTPPKKKPKNNNKNKENLMDCSVSPCTLNSLQMENLTTPARKKKTRICVGIMASIEK